jgi:deazaflavin-dependent oxidoreductase (nitroreductase family)
MQLPQWMAVFTRDVANRFWRLCAGWIPAHGILEHVGRRSGKPYRTPLMVFDADVDGQPGFVIMLTYGPNRDWLKNLTAAKSARMRRHGKTIGVTDPQVVPRAEAAQHVIKGWRPIIAKWPFDQAVLLTKGR